MNAIFTRRSQSVTDPYVFPKRRGVDYAAIAEAQVDRCLDLMVELDQAERARAATGDRLRAGDAWFADKTSDHPRYRNGLKTQGKLMARLLVQSERERTAARDLWMACCNLYAALCHTEPLYAKAVIKPLGIDVPAHPRDAWDVLTGGREPPDTWPPSEHSHYIEH